MPPALRRLLPAALCLALATPFLFVSIPPLSDVPGHIGQAAIAAYAPTDPAFAALMRTRWSLIPNLGSELTVAALGPLIGIQHAFWLISAAIPVLLAAGILLLAKALTPMLDATTSPTVPWALIFIYSYPFNLGLLNYMLGVALAFLAAAAWIILTPRPVLREALAWAAIPLVFLCHAMAGCLLILLIASHELTQPCRTLRRLATTLRPMLPAALILLAWRLTAHPTAPADPASLTGKLNALVMLLRDQDIVLDIGSLAAAAFAFTLAWRAGIRPHRAVIPALLTLLAGFAIIPTGLGGGHYADLRLLPVIAMLAFATAVTRDPPPRLARRIQLSGLTLLVLRLAVTTIGFTRYEARDRSELAALAHIPPHSRIAVLVTADCNARPSAWRTQRLGHLADLALLRNRSWTNSEWDIDGAHQLQIVYRPSRIFYDDPSQFIWPSQCGPPTAVHHGLATALSTVPAAGVDFLWLIDAALPNPDPRLRAVWHNDTSTLFAVGNAGKEGQGSALDPLGSGHPRPLGLGFHGR